MSENPHPTRKYDSQTWAESGKKLFGVPETADIWFLVNSKEGSLERIPAHKNILAVYSDVFRRRFHGPLKGENEIRIENVTAEAFIEFVQFFYNSTMNLTMENIGVVIQLADDYNVAKCFELCVRFFRETTNDHNVCAGLGVAIHYDHKYNDVDELRQLKAFCENRISLNSEAVFKSPEFLSCERQVLKHILNMGLLACTEAEVFEACISWVKSVSKENLLSKLLIETHLGDLFYDIRFASMTMVEFTKLIYSHATVFSPEEFNEIIQIITKSEFRPTIFKEEPREAKWNPEAVISCDRYRYVSNFSTDKSYGLVPTDRITVSTSEPVLLRSFKCAKICVYRSGRNYGIERKVDIEVEIVEALDLQEIRANGNTLKTLRKQKAILNVNLYSSFSAFSLKSPVLMRPGYFYGIYVTLPVGCADIYKMYAGELKSEVLISSDIKISFHLDRKSEEGFIIGLINALDFNHIRKLDMNEMQ